MYEPQHPACTSFNTFLAFAGLKHLSKGVSFLFYIAPPPWPSSSEIVFWPFYLLLNLLEVIYSPGIESGPLSIPIAFLSLPARPRPRTRPGQTSSELPKLFSLWLHWKRPIWKEHLRACLILTSRNFLISVFIFSRHLTIWRCWAMNSVATWFTTS